MDVSPFRQIDDVLQAALARPVRERIEFLTNACARKDEASRREVQELLDIDGKPEPCRLNAQSPEYREGVRRGRRNGHNFMATDYD
jgi:hypothetical protein